MSDLDRTRDAVGGLLTEVAMHFKGRPKITLLVRHPNLEAQGKDADFVMTDDRLEHAIAALQRRAALAATAEGVSDGGCYWPNGFATALSPFGSSRCRVSPLRASIAFAGDQLVTYQPDIVIYHDHCADGFAAAWACWMRWCDACQYVPASYGQPAPDVSGKHVLIVDFSYKRDVLREMGKTAKSLIVLDHHKTAAADLAEWTIDDVSGEFWAGDAPLKAVAHNDERIGQPIAAIFNMEKSGARLAWEFCHDTDWPTPRLIDLVEDRDLWRFWLEDTKPFSLWLRSEPFSFDRFEILKQEIEDCNDGARIMTEARAMQRFFDAKVDEIASFADFEALAEHKPIMVNCPPMFSSEVGHALLDKHPAAPFAAMWYETRNKRMWSLRSRDERADVSEIASLFGGGGHRNAAGFGEPRRDRDVSLAEDAERLSPEGVAARAEGIAQPDPATTQRTD